MVAAALAASAALAAGVAAAGGPDVPLARAPGVEAEVAAVADPGDPDVLLAAANRAVVPVRMRDLTMRLYESADGGATWATQLGPPRPTRTTCVIGDPALAIDGNHVQYAAFLGLSGCSARSLRYRVYVASRAGPGSPWRTPTAPVSVPTVRRILDDKPALAVDLVPGSPHPNRLYAAWTRGRLTGGFLDEEEATFTVVLSWSDDAGATWSRPVQVSDRGHGGTFAALAPGPGGRVAVAWQGERGLYLDRSLDGGVSFGADRLAAPLPGGPLRGACIPAQDDRCVTATPTLVSDPGSGELYLTYAERAGRRGALDVVTRILGPDLDERARTQPAGPAGPVPGDRFQPVAARDASTGRLWACWYDTAPDRARRSASFTCSASSDRARTWAPPVRAASVPSDESRPPAYSFQYGDYQGLAVAGGAAHPVWTDGRDVAGFGEEIYTKTLLDADVSGG